MRSTLGTVTWIVLCGFVGVAGCSKSPEPPTVENKSVASVPSPKATAPQPVLPVPPAVVPGTVKFEFHHLDAPDAIGVLDGSEYRLAELTTDRSLSAGDHELVVRVGGQDRAHARFQVIAGKRSIVEVRHADGIAAEWALGLGGAVTVQPAKGKPVRVTKAMDLPAAPFRVTFIDLWYKGKVLDEGLVGIGGLKSQTQFWPEKSGR